MSAASPHRPIAAAGSSCTTTSPSRTAISVDPKSYLSNERTYYRYLHMSLLLLVTSLLLLRFPNSFTGTDPDQAATTRLCAYFLAVVAVFVVVWSYVVFHRRVSKGKTPLPHTEKEGAFLLTTSCCFSRTPDHTEQSHSGTCTCQRKPPHLCHCSGPGIAGSGALPRLWRLFVSASVLRWR
ncbi:unnamed protein product [Amoebophrya sp. A120]|nr:unnamed protein product [Amoebophrya sp. A120]|eukprot:GSA120T00020635001.1